MFTQKILMTLILSVTLSVSQTISLKGTVNDCYGIAVSGAAVTLEEAAITTITAADGSFNLSGTTGAVIPKKREVRPTTYRMSIKNGKLVINLTEKTHVAVTVYTLLGRHLSTIANVYQPGLQRISLPQKGTGIHLVKVTAGNESCILKSTFSGAGTVVSASSPSLSDASHNQAKTVATLNDGILVTKNGYLNYRQMVSTTDSGGIIITLLPNAGDITDVDGNVYQTVRIGSQIWTVDNWRSTRYNDRSTIPHISDSAKWTKVSTPAYCFYNNSTDSAYQKKWGALYNWFFVSSENPQQIGPDGWRVPSNADWDTLKTYLITNGYNFDGTTNDNKIAKSVAAKTDWPGSRTADGYIGYHLHQNNSSGFSALPAGYRSYSGKFNYHETNSIWWSSNGVNASFAYNRQLSYNGAFINDPFRQHADTTMGMFKLICEKQYGASVRLVRDLTVQEQQQLPVATVVYNGNENTSGTSPGVQFKKTAVALTVASNTGSFAKDGSVFAGWNTMPDGSGTFYAEGAPYTSDTSLVLFAKWNVIPTYAVTYHGNGNYAGTLPSSQVKIENVPLTLALNNGDLLKKGHVFDGWNTSPDGFGSNYAEGAEYIKNETVTLYAKWAAATNVLPAPVYGTPITDNDGNVYTTVRIGNQEWTVENWRCTTYNDGTAIPPVTDGKKWASLTTPAYCYYNNTTDSATQRKWGALYNWYAVNTGKLAPKGWRLPTDADWDSLQNYLLVNGYNWDGTTTGNKLAKSLAANIDWSSAALSGSPGATPETNNSSGFTALPAGERGRSGDYGFQNKRGSWWSTGAFDMNSGNYRGIDCSQKTFNRSYFLKFWGLSVRLVRDR